MNDLSKIVFAPSSKESILINNPMSAIFFVFRNLKSKKKFLKCNFN